MRKVTDYYEIIKHFAQILRDNTRVLIWQTVDDDGKKRLTHCELSEINYLAKTISFKPIDLSEAMLRDFKIGEKIFIRGTSQEMLFKRNKFKIENGKIIFPIPKIIQLNEKRESDRFFLGPRSGHNVFANKRVNNDNSITRRYRLPIYDFSEMGFSLIIPKKEIPFFEIGETLDIYQVAELNLESSLAAKIQYLSRFQYCKNSSKQTFYRIGVRLEECLPVEIFQFLYEKSLEIAA